MLKKIMLMAAAFFCIAMSNIPAMAVYSGITGTVESVIQLKERNDEQNMIFQIYKDTNIQPQKSTESNAILQLEPGTDSNAKRE